MSIVTLKKKTQAKYNSMSVGSKTGFSLNGTHRNQGYVGQNVISRALSVTPIKHYGGCCGKYPQGHIVLNGITSTENINVVKKSVLDTRGMIDTKYRWIRRSYPFVTVKPDATLNMNNQNSYIENLAKNTIYEVNKCNYIAPKSCDAGLNTDVKKKCIITKDNSEFVAMEQSRYIEELQEKCTKNDVFYVPKKTCSYAFIGSATTY